MSNLNNVYAACPGLMSDGRSQNTDYKSHNEVLKEMKGSIENSYDFRVKLQGSGIRDMAENIRFNMCSTVPAGDIKLNREINLNIEKKGSYLDAFGPLSSNTFFSKPVSKIVVPNPELTLPANKLPLYSPYKSGAQVAAEIAAATAAKALADAQAIQAAQAASDAAAAKAVADAAVAQAAADAAAAQAAADAAAAQAAADAAAAKAASDAAAAQATADAAIAQATADAAAAQTAANAAAAQTAAEQPITTGELFNNMLSSFKRR
jgi:hypothetical protein